MRCEQARQLFDPYLNGELSTPMATELHAHRVKCAACRRELALLEVSGHVLKADDDPVQLDVNFTDRLIACVDSPRSRWSAPLRWSAYVGAPLAAAAVVAMAFLGVFDAGSNGKVASEVTSIEAVLGEPPVPPVLADAPVEPAVSNRSHPLDAWFHEVQADTDAKRRNGPVMQDTLDLTILQLLDILEDAKKANSTDPASQRASEAGDPLPEPRQGAFDDGL